MFSFNFGSGAEENELKVSTGDTRVANEKPSFEILPADGLATFEWKKAVSHIYVADLEIAVADSAKTVDLLKNHAGCDKLSTLKADRDNSDLLPGIYEGGMKIWECTYDLGTYSRKNHICFENKSVLDLGCGAGVLGIVALKQGSSYVHFQDYNSEVLRYLTVPSVLLNGPHFLDRSKFWSGDWRSYEEADGTTFDVILSSETIYNPFNHLKLHRVLQKKLKPGGSIFIAGKSYYFGVGGSMKGFREVVESQKVFSVETIWTSLEGVKREIILLKHLASS